MDVLVRVLGKAGGSGSFGVQARRAVLDERLGLAGGPLAGQVARAAVGVPVHALALDVRLVRSLLVGVPPDLGGVVGGEVVVPRPDRPTVGGGEPGDEPLGGLER